MMKMRRVLLIVAAIALSARGEGHCIGIAETCDTNGLVSAFANYVEAVRAAGDVPVVLPRLDSREGVARQLERVDALVLCGGEDVDPALYGEAPSPKLGDLNRTRDAFERLLLDEAARRRLPVLGICRGCQLMNVHFGGTLVQDIPSELPRALKHVKARGEGSAARHPVRFEPGSRLRAVMGADEVEAVSWHHQSVDRVAPGFRVAARSADGVVEAIEGDGLPFTGVQFHPEMSLAEDPSDALGRIFAEILSVTGGREGLNVMSRTQSNTTERNTR